jgi:hypothetical protein
MFRENYKKTMAKPLKADAGIQGALIFLTACAHAFAEHIEALEAQLASGGPKSLLDAFRGTWKSGETYHRGELVTYQGSLWFVHRDSDERPGTSPAYQLCVKSGRAR